MGTEILIKPLDESHIEALTLLERICFNDPWSKQTLTSEIYNQSAHFLTAFVDENIAGYIGVNEICDTAFIANLAVFPEYRKTGVGTALLNAAEKGARDRGLCEITLEVRTDNEAAVALYKKEGFETLGVRRGFYRNPQGDAYIMTKILRSD